MHVPVNVRPWLAILTITLIFLSTGLSPAQASSEESVLSLAQAELLAINNNPALKAAGKQAEAMAAIPSQVGSLPDPRLSLGTLNLPVDSFSTSQEPMTQMQLGISQAFPFPGKLGLKELAAEHMAAMALQNQQEFRLVLVRNTRIHWWNLAYLDSALSILRHNQELLRNLVRIAETKYKTGKGLQQDVLLAQLELSKLLDRELMLGAARESEAASLNALLGRAARSTIVLPRQAGHALSDIKFNVDALKESARTFRPMLVAMDYNVQAADARVALAEKDNYPDFNLGASYGFRQGVNPANGQSRPDMASIMFSMSVPLYSGSKQDKAVDQRTAEKAAAEFSWQDAANQVDAEIDAAASDLRISRDRVALFEQGILPQARQTTASMLAGYQVNKVDFLNLIGAQLSKFNMEIQYWQQVSRVHQAEARLTAAAGRESLGLTNPHKDDNHE
ncbi:MAG TPA: TolC family protein [Mariprofundaceae bacterium]|nr:TolC family protein [Mariprofundaceae bacterium]